MVTGYLKRLIRKAPLDEPEARELFGDMLDGKVSPTQIGAVLTAMRIKGESSEELRGAARAILQRAERLEYPDEVFDVSRTGGEAPSTFDVSTASAVLVAACGLRVVAHVAPQLPGRIGAFEVASHLGLLVTPTCADVLDRIDQHGIVFVPRERTLGALETLARYAAELEMRTLVDLLAPLANPAQPRFQLIGTHVQAHMAPLAQAAGELGRERVWVVRGDDGLDELTLTGPSHVVAYERDAGTTFMLDPRDYGFELCQPESLHGGPLRENAALVAEVLRGERRGPLADAVVLNAGASLHVAGRARNLHRGIEMARDCLRSGNAGALFAKLSQRAPTR